jgi:hypothetical protein
MATIQLFSEKLGINNSFLNVPETYRKRGPFGGESLVVLS